jgi:FkbM family methyltransferase
MLTRVLRRALPPTLKEHAILGGPLRGCRIVTSWRDYPAGVTGRTERHLLAWFTREVGEGETWLDVGAHYGYTAIALSRLVGGVGRVFAFEPVVASAGCVAATKRVNRFDQLTVVPLGLGSPSPGPLTTIALPLTRGMADRTLVGHAGLATQSLHIARFDWLWPLMSGPSDAIHGIKIDVQGMERDVLCGMATILQRQRPKLVIEFHAGVDRAEIVDFLAGLGYGRHAEPVEPQGVGPDLRLMDDRSYAFRAS